MNALVVRGPWTPRQALWLQLLKEFVHREGHARVPSKHREGNFRLGGWVAKRRTDYRQGRLTPERVKALEAFTGWTWDPLEDDFKQGLALLRTFVKRHGHAAVPHAHRQGNFQLGYWVAVRRIQYAQGALAEGRIRVLAALPGWSWNRRVDHFAFGLERLRRFARREGHARVPARHRELGFTLGGWVERLRRAHAKGRLPRHRVRALEAIRGWTWDVRADLFERGLGALKIFVKREKHARVPKEFVERGYPLGDWVSSRREQYKAGKLSETHRRLLEGVPGWTWNVYERAFEEGYSRLARYVKREGHARVARQHWENGFPLGRWVLKRRHRRHRLKPEQIRRLSVLPGWTWGRRPRRRAAT